MATKRILLWDMPDELMLVVAHPSGVEYHNQVGGVVCYKEQLEGVLCPLDVSDDMREHIQKLAYPGGRQGITVEIADTIDALLASRPAAAFVRVDRERMDDSWEAWVYVVIDSPESDVPTLFGPYFGSLYGFGTVKGVLTWPNSD